MGRDGFRIQKPCWINTICTSRTSVLKKRGKGLLSRPKLVLKKHRNVFSTPAAKVVIIDECRKTFFFYIFSFVFSIFFQLFFQHVFNAPFQAFCTPEWHPPAGFFNSGRGAPPEASIRAHLTPRVPIRPHTLPQAPTRAHMPPNALTRFHTQPSAHIRSHAPPQPNES